MVFNIFEYISEDMRRQREENQRLIKEAIEKYGDLEPTYYDEDGFLRHRTIFLGKTKKYANNTLGQVVNDGVVSGFNEDDFLEYKYRTLLSNVRNYLENEEAENLVTYIYLDSNRYITTGIGNNINDKEKFLNIDFMIGDRLATYQEKLEVYNKFKEMSVNGVHKNNYTANYYKQFSNLRINNKIAKNLMSKHTLNDLKKLRKGIEGFDKLPLPLQEVLMDIRYNTGNVSKLNWPKLMEGVRSKNLSLIADNVNRKGVSAKRNKWARDKILSIKEKW